MELTEAKLRFAIMMGQAGDYDRKIGESQFAIEDYRIAACLLKEFNDYDMDWTIFVTLYLRLGDLYLDNKKYNTSDNYYQKALKIAEEHLTNHWKDKESLDYLRTCQMKLGDLAVEQEHPLMAEYRYRTALRTAESLYRLTKSDEDLAKIAYAYFYIGQNDADGCIGMEYLKRSREILIKLVEKYPSNSEYEEDLLVADLMIAMTELIQEYRREKGE